jgi:hypothetical protein
MCSDILLSFPLRSGPAENKVPTGNSKSLQLAESSKTTYVESEQLASPSNPTEFDNNNPNETLLCHLI